MLDSQPTSNELHHTIRCLYIATIIGGLIYTDHFHSEGLGIAALMGLAVPSVVDVVSKMVGKK